MENIQLFGLAFLAGLVDAVAGGGGLIQLPALFLFLPQALSGSVPVVLGTNKLSSICGTGVACARYARKIAIPWRTMGPTCLAAFVFSLLGASVASSLNSALLKPVILALLIALVIYTFLQKDFGLVPQARFSARREKVWGLVVGVGIGFYDGFFGPGTGSFLAFIFVRWFGYDLLTATAATKAVNLSTNLAAVILFGLTGNILFGYGLLMGLCNLAGALVGTRLALLKGSPFIRRVFLLVAAAMIARFGYDLFFAAPGH